MAEGMDAQQRRESYACDVTYVTNSELGFDFLRDNLATRRARELCVRCDVCDQQRARLRLPSRQPCHSSQVERHPSSLLSLSPHPLYNVLQTKDELVLRDFHYCVIDEVYSILNDEARTPLIISGP
ncbi:unnamed protein product, partial [Closterium sp. NIES-54]